MRPSLLLLPLSLIAIPASAKSPSKGDPLVTAVGSCRQVTDSAARLACYDKAASALASAVEEGAIAVVSREDANRTRRSLFGFSVPSFPFFKDRGEQAEIKNLNSTVASARSIGNGRYRVTLADGNAVWETTESSLAMRDPRPGQAVQITRGAIGSYWMKIANGREVRARRVQ